MANLKVAQTVVFLSIFVGYSLYVLCRKSFSFVIPYVQSEEKLSKEDLGKIVSALNLAYAISKFMFGILSDKVSATLLFCSGLTATAVSVVGFSYFHDVNAFAALCFLNGIGQGCGWPACSKILRKWFQKDQFGTWWSVLSASANVTGVVVPMVLQFFVLANGGWRNFMLFSGGLSILWALLCLLSIKDSPESIGLPSFTEPKNDAGDRKKHDDAATDDSNETLNDVLKSPFLWLISAYYLVVFAAKTSFENWVQLLIVDDKKMAISDAVAFVSLFETGGMIGSFSTGYLTDIFVARIPNAKSSPRMIVVIIYMLASVLALQALMSSNSYLPISAVILGFSIYGNINVFGIVATESAPVHLSGTSHSIVSLAANIGAILAGYPFSVVADTYGWTGVFTLLQIGCFVCLIALIVTKNLSSTIGADKKKKE